jgi:formate/nitrite transporter FocA (FNT family)
MANVAGAGAFALLVARTPALNPEFLSQLAHIGLESVQRAPSSIIWSAVVAGWMIAWWHGWSPPRIRSPAR